MGPDTSSLVMVSPIRKVSSSLVLSCFKQAREYKPLPNNPLASFLRDVICEYSLIKNLRTLVNLMPDPGGLTTASLWESSMGLLDLNELKSKALTGPLPVVDMSSLVYSLARIMEETS